MTQTATCGGMCRAPPKFTLTTCDRMWQVPPKFTLTTCGRMWQVPPKFTLTTCGRMWRAPPKFTRCSAYKWNEHYLKNILISWSRRSDSNYLFVRGKEFDWLVYVKYVQNELSGWVRGGGACLKMGLASSATDKDWNSDGYWMVTAVTLCKVEMLSLTFQPQHLCLWYFDLKHVLIIYSMQLSTYVLLTDIYFAPGSEKSVNCNNYFIAYMAKLVVERRWPVIDEAADVRKWRSLNGV